MRNNFIFFLIINTFKDTNVFLRCSFKHFFKLTCICNKWSILLGIQIERPKPIYDLSSEVQNTTYNFSNQINDIAKSCFNCINYTFKHPYNNYFKITNSDSSNIFSTSVLKASTFRIINLFLSFSNNSWSLP